MKLYELLQITGLCKSKSQAKTLISQGGAYINNVKITDVNCDVHWLKFENGDIMPYLETLDKIILL